MLNDTKKIRKAQDQIPQWDQNSKSGYKHILHKSHKQWKIL